MANNNPLAGFTPSTPPPAIGPSTTGRIGVPTDYKAPVIPGGYRTIPSTLFGTQLYDQTDSSKSYMDGDEWKVPLSHPENIPDLKLQLYQAGLLDRKTLGNPAVWDINAANAYRKVLEFANAYGMRAVDAMGYFVSNPKAGSAGRMQSVVSYTNPADVQSGFQNVSQQLTGQEQPTGDFESYFRGQEAAANAGQVGATDAAYSGKGQGGSQSYTQAPSVSGAAQQYVLEHDPSQVLAYGVASRMQEFLSALGVK